MSDKDDYLLLVRQNAGDKCRVAMVLERALHFRDRKHGPVIVGVAMRVTCRFTRVGGGIGGDWAPRGLGPRKVKLIPSTGTESIASAS